MRLSELGELGLLAELERRGLISGSRTTPPQLARRIVVTQDALVEGVHFRLDWLSWRELGFRAAAVNLSDLAASGAEARGAARHARAAGRDRRRGRLRALRRHRRGRRAGRRRGHDRGRRRCSLSVTAIGRAERVPGRAGARPGRPARRHRPARRARARRSARAAYVRPPLRTRGGHAARGGRRTRMLDISDGLAVDAGPPGPPLGRSLRDRARPRPARRRARPSTTSASARTTSCSPPSTIPAGSSVIGTVEDGPAVEWR